MADELVARLDTIRRGFSSALLIGGDSHAASELRARGLAVTVADAGFAAAGDVGDIQCDEDRLPFADRSFDLVMAIGTLDTVNDLPGALVLIRRALRPDGLFLSAMIGAGSLPVLRTVISGGSGVARFHPLIDVRSAGDLLGRAGFALPVADAENVNARYADLGRLVADLRANGLRNLLAQRQAMTRQQLAAASAAFAQPNTKTTEQMSIVYLTGWAPALRGNVQADR